MAHRAPDEGEQPTQAKDQWGFRDGLSHVLVIRCWSLHLSP